MSRWLNYLLGVEGPENSQISGWHFVPSWGGLALILLVVIAAAFLAGRLYRGEAVRLSRRLYFTLIACRLAALFALLTLIMQPVSCGVDLKGTRNRPLALILDDSSSMAQKDLRGTVEEQKRAEAVLGKELASEPEAMPARLEIAKAILQKEDSPLLEKMKAAGPLRRYLLGVDLRRVHDQTPWSEWLNQWTAGQPRTSLNAGIDRLLSLKEDLPTALVVFTDGRDTGSGKSLAALGAEAGRKGVPFYFVGIGVEQPARLELRDMQAPDILQAGELVAVPVRWKVGDFDKEKITSAKVEIRLELDGVEVAKETLPAKPGEDIRHALLFRPPFAATRKNGSKLEVFARVTGLGLERPEDKLAKEIRVIDRKLRVLVVDKSPRWDLRFLLMNLTREQVASTEEGASPRFALQPKFVILEGDTALTANEPFLPEFPPTRKDLFSFDVVILGDVPADKLGPDGPERLRQFVEEGGGLLILGGKRFNGTGWNETPLADLLPLEPGSPDPALGPDKRTSHYQPQLTPEGSRHDAMRLGETQEASERIWKELPGMFWHAPVKKLKPGAVALLNHPTVKAETLQLPLVATQSYGRGQTAYFGFDESWRWRFNEGETYYGRFWSQWVYWAAGPRSGAVRQVRLTTDRPDPSVGSMGLISARVLDANFLPDKREKVAAKLEWLDAPAGFSLEMKRKEVFLRPLPDHPGEFQLPLVHDKLGRFALIVPGDPETRVEWRVFPPADFEKGGLAWETLVDAARQSGGACLRENDASQLIDLLKSKEAPVVFRAELPRLHPFLFLLLTIALSVEWTLRRWNNLS
ncbi:MAG: hypothetical protein EXR99_10485 [Gemmataceae bacterium]|nr:hypothetical protein [Gemmataceae bacterium]